MQPEAQPRWRQALYFLAGVGLTVLVGFAAYRLWPKPALPDGWMRLAPPDDVMALAEYRGRIWAGGRDGVVALDRDTGGLLYEVEGDVPFEYVTSLALSAATESVWVGHLRGVSRYDGRAWQTFAAADGLTGGRVLALLEDDDGALWVGTEQGLSRFHDGIWKRFTSADGLAGNAVSYLFQDSQGRIWAGGGLVYQAGVSVYDGQTWTTPDVEAHLVHPMLNAMLEDATGALWYGTGFSAYGGLSIHGAGGWRTLTKEDGLAGAKVRYLYEDAAGVIWVGSEHDGILRMDPNGWQILTPGDGLAGWEVLAMLQDSQGNLWLGTELGLTRISHEAWARLGR